MIYIKIIYTISFGKGGEKIMKSKLVSTLLNGFLGCWGIHRFYLGKIGTGILWLCTFGLFGFGEIIDFIMIICGSFKDKSGAPLK